MTREELIDFYKEILDDYPIASIEDPFAEDDFAGFARLTKLYGKKIQIVGDDLFTTNKSRLLNGIAKKSGNAILIKPNQSRDPLRNNRNGKNRESKRIFYYNLT